MQRHQIAKAGQVILSEIWGKGAIGFVPCEGEGALCTSHFFLFDLARDKVEPGWLAAIFPPTISRNSWVPVRSAQPAMPLFAPRACSRQQFPFPASRTAADRGEG